ncbi:MAG: helix-hairpin-helix domain-containing protein [Anaerolineae bacterium]|nr:helix-hairpin-helix domain-containing protein [Anaerolineae bacterium]
MTALPDVQSELPETPEEIRARIRREYRLYLVCVAVISLMVGGVLGASTLGSQPGEVHMAPTSSIQMLSQGAAGFPTPDQTANVVTVYVSGAVSAAQVVTLPFGSLVSDALSAAGGVSPEADLDALNMAAPVRDHAHILVPTAVAQPVQFIEGLLDINKANAAELEALPNIGPSRAQQIIAYREAHGDFERIQDIMNVSGIGPAIFEQLSPYITVEIAPP